VSLVRPRALPASPAPALRQALAALLQPPGEVTELPARLLEKAMESSVEATNYEPQPAAAPSYQPQCVGPRWNCLELETKQYSSWLRHL
jgi:hypothetical protein